MMVMNEPALAQHAIKKVVKVWGVEYWITNGEKYCLKFLKVNPGYLSSIHAHTVKDETFIGVMGTLALNLHKSDGYLLSIRAIHPGVQYHIPPGTFHSFQAVNTCWIMEVSTQHSDKDVIRLQESRRLDQQ
jgi:D-lyxose ketol-isomerase